VTGTTISRSGTLGIGLNRTAAWQLLFGATILTSSCLLFIVQPLASKLILPWFGGSAAVWITCMLFFQSGLLLGYSYAHALTRWLKPRYQAIVHAALLAGSLGALPILPNPVWQPKPGQDPTWLVFGVLATSLGLPYALLSSTSPLLQSWYAETNRGALPYRYFALSNAGSLAALLAYPVLVEPYLTGRQQAWIWSLAFLVFVALCAFTAVFAGGERSSSSRAEQFPAKTKPANIRIVLWLSLAACASTLLLAVTSLLIQNIAPIPLLWVLPLGIYLLSFILCFESDRWYQRVIFLPLVLPALGCLVAGAGPLNNAKISLLLPLLAAALFVCCMACHGELARSRPAAPQLTTFYLCVAAGGTLGGLFAALLAPHIFRAMYEYPIAFVGCAALLLLIAWRERRDWRQPNLGFALWTGALAASVLLAVYVVRETWRNAQWAVLLERNFYGALRVADYQAHNHRYRLLSHGTITHGVQLLSPLMRQQPVSYYARNSAVGLTWQALAPTGPLRMGVVGLGVGTLAAYGRAGDTLRFYEINPEVVKIAKTQFTYLSGCPAHVDMVVGDARLSMAHEPSQRFDVLVIDAFSGDAIPVHLLTREAFALYWRHLKPDGVLAVHVSNRYLDLSPLVLLAAKESGMDAWEVDGDDDDAYEIYTSTYVLVSNRPGFFDHPLLRGMRIKTPIPPHLRVWTDDFSNLWQVLNLKGVE
jgi:SAM-dependent methyltransferase